MQFLRIKDLMLWLIIILMPYPWLSVNLGVGYLHLVDAILIFFAGILLVEIALFNKLRLPSGAFMMAALFMMVVIVFSTLASDANIISVKFIISTAIKLVLIILIYQVIHSKQSLEKFIALYTTSMVVAAISGMGDFVWNILINQQWYSIKGFFGSRNEMVFYLLPALVISLGYSIRNDIQHWERQIYLVKFAILYMTILVSLGRAGILLATLAIFFTMILNYKKKRMIKIVLLFGSMFIALLILLSMQYSEIFEKFASRYLFFLDGESAFVGDDVRAGLVSIALLLFQENIFLGIGPALFSEYSGAYIFSIITSIKGVPDNLNPHNAYLGVLAEQGLAGAFAFLFMLVAVFKGGTRGLIKNQCFVDSVLIGAFMILLVHMLFIAGLHLYNFWFFVGIVLAMGGLKSEYRARAR